MAPVPPITTTSTIGSMDDLDAASSRLIGFLPHLLRADNAS